MGVGKDSVESKPTPHVVKHTRTENTDGNDQVPHDPLQV